MLNEKKMHTFTHFYLKYIYSISCLFQTFKTYLRDADKMNVQLKMLYTFVMIRSFVHVKNIWTCIMNAKTKSGFIN